MPIYTKPIHAEKLAEDVASHIDLTVTHIYRSIYERKKNSLYDIAYNTHICVEYTLEILYWFKENKDSISNSINFEMEKHCKQHKLLYYSIKENNTKNTICIRQYIEKLIKNDTDIPYILYQLKFILNKSPIERRYVLQIFMRGSITAYNNLTAFFFKETSKYLNPLKKLIDHVIQTTLQFPSLYAFYEEYANFDTVYKDSSIIA